MEIFMFDCLILGDSIAVGTAQFRQECVSYSKGGWNSWQWNKHYIDQQKTNLSAKSVIISLGTNDLYNVNTFKELMALRQTIDSERVVWILPPIKPEIQDVVRIIAKNYKDTILEIPELSKDKIHPTYNGYKKLAQLSK